MSELLGIDYGDKWVGTAIGSSEVRIALPHRTFPRAKGSAEGAILELIDERGISTAVVGLPLSADGAETPQCAKVRRFCSRLQRRAKLQVIYVDEHLSSSEAEQRLAELNPHGGSSAGLDSVSASIILQEYLNKLPAGSVSCEN